MVTLALNKAIHVIRDWPLMIPFKGGVEAETQVTDVSSGPLFPNMATFRGWPLMPLLITTRIVFHWINGVFTVLFFHFLFLPPFFPTRIPVLCISQPVFYYIFYFLVCYTRINFVLSYCLWNKVKTEIICYIVEYKLSSLRYCICLNLRRETWSFTQNLQSLFTLLMHGSKKPNKNFCNKILCWVI